jgi:hypothetical protein
MLAILLVLMAPLTLADPSYYTWVDAQGVIHNTAIETEAKPSKNRVEEKTQKLTISEKPIAKESLKDNQEIEDGEKFQTEEEFHQNLKSSDDKPFYTWTDADGTIRNNPKPDLELEFTANEIVYDAVFAPPFRLPSRITEGVCCIEYKDSFVKKLQRDSLTGQKINNNSLLYKTQQGFKPAAFFIVEGIEKEIIFIKGFKLTEQAKFEIIALNEAYQPIYLTSNLSGLFIKQTWKDLAYSKVMLELSDPEIKYLIVFALDNDLDMDRGYTLSLSQGKASD